MLAPICLFTYNRYRETKQTVEALQKDYLAKESDLIIFSDGPKNEASVSKIQEVRQFLLTISGFRSVEIIESLNNKGLANSIIGGVTQIINQYGKVIVLEDDIVVSRGFLTYMNNALNFYESDEQVMQVASYMFAIDSSNLPDTFFYSANTCWGWGTWKEAWKKFNPDSESVLSELKKKNISWNQFNAMQGKEFQKQLLKNLNGKLITWAVKWHAAIILNNGKVVHPKTSYVLNIGFAGNGENCKKGQSEGLIDNNLNLDVSDASNYDNEKALYRLNKYFKKRYSFLNKINRKIKSYINF